MDTQNIPDIPEAPKTKVGRPKGGKLSPEEKEKSKLNAKMLQKKWREDHMEEHRQHMKDYREKNKVQLAQSNAEYYKNVASKRAEEKAKKKKIELLQKLLVELKDVIFVK